MSKKLLKKLSSVIASPEDTTAPISEVDSRLSTVLEEHLDVIAAAHQSQHSSHHASTPGPKTPNQPSS
jgi:hypothetical protein